MKTTPSARTAVNPPPNAPARSFLARHLVLWMALLIVAAGGAIYANSLRGVFVFDDISDIVRNPGLRHAAIRQALDSTRPVVSATLALNYAWSATDPWSYHLVNMAVHILAALALFGIVRRTLLQCRLPIADCRMITEKSNVTENDSQPRASTRTTRAQPDPNTHSAIGNPGAHARPGQSAIASWLALVIALLWMVHPIQTESVTYVIQRLESLMGMFYLITLYCFIRSTSSAKPLAWQVAAVAACALGMGSKEVMASAPLIVLLYDRSFIAGGFREALRRRGGLYLALAATWLILARSVIGAVSAHPTFAGFQLHVFTPLQYALSQPGVILHYLLLSFRPWPLCLDYGRPAAGGIGEIAPGAIVIGGLLAATVWALVRQPKLGFFGAWFFLILAPTSSIMPINDLVFDHRMYLPLAAVITGAVLAAVWCWNRAWPVPSGKWSGCALAGAAILAVAGLGFLTVRRNAEYRDAVTLWKDTVRCAPRNGRAYGNLGTAYLEAGAPEEAFRCFDKSVELAPNYALAWFWRGAAYAKAGRTEEALHDLDRAIALQPDLVAAYVNRGNVYAASNRCDDAIRDYDRAIALQPDDADAWFDRGNVYARTGPPEKALSDLGQAIALDPDFAEAHVSRGVVHAAAHHYAEAMRDYDRAIALKPGDAHAWFSRGMACARTGQAEEALRDLDRAIALKPDYAEAYYNRGNIRLDARRFDEAIRDFDQAIALKPDDADAWFNRANAFVAAGQLEQAVRDYSQAIELRPKDPDAWYNRGMVRKRLKQDSEALADFQMARKLGATVPEELLRSLGPAAQPPRY